MPPLQIAKAVRQVDDAANKMIGGISAGGVLGHTCKTLKRAEG